MPPLHRDRHMHTIIRNPVCSVPELLRRSGRVIHPIGRSLPVVLTDEVRIVALTLARGGDGADREHCLQRICRLTADLVWCDDT